MGAPSDVDEPTKVLLSSRPMRPPQASHWRSERSMANPNEITAIPAGVCGSRMLASSPHNSFLLEKSLAA
jgi:hypothetical protein